MADWMSLDNLFSFVSPGPNTAGVDEPEQLRSSDTTQALLPWADDDLSLEGLHFNFGTNEDSLEDLLQSPRAVTNLVPDDEEIQKIISSHVENEIQLFSTMHSFAMENKSYLPIDFPVLAEASPRLEKTPQISNTPGEAVGNTTSVAAGGIPGVFQFQVSTSTTSSSATPQTSTETTNSKMSSHIKPPGYSEFQIELTGPLGINKTSVSAPSTAKALQPQNKPGESVFQVKLLPRRQSEQVAQDAKTKKERTDNREAVKKTSPCIFCALYREKCNTYTPCRKCERSLYDGTLRISMCYRASLLGTNGYDGNFHILDGVYGSVEQYIEVISFLHHSIRDSEDLGNFSFIRFFMKFTAHQFSTHSFEALDIKQGRFQQNMVPFYHVVDRIMKFNMTLQLAAEIYTKLAGQLLLKSVRNYESDEYDDGNWYTYTGSNNESNEYYFDSSDIYSDDGFGENDHNNSDFGRDNDSDEYNNGTSIIGSDDASDEHRGSSQRIFDVDKDVDMLMILYLQTQARDITQYFYRMLVFADRMLRDYIKHGSKMEMENREQLTAVPWLLQAGLKSLYVTLEYHIQKVGGFNNRTRGEKHARDMERLNLVVDGLNCWIKVLTKRNFFDLGLAHSFFGKYGYLVSEDGGWITVGRSRPAEMRVHIPKEHITLGEDIETTVDPGDLVDLNSLQFDDWENVEAFFERIRDTVIEEESDLQGRHLGAGPSEDFVSYCLAPFVDYYKSRAAVENIVGLASSLPSTQLTEILKKLRCSD